MKRSVVILIVVAVIALIAYSSFKGGYNNMVTKEEAVEAAWSQVENVYQRRADLIPNLVNVVKGAANFEKETLTGVVEARAKATQITVDPKNLTPEKIQEFQAAQGELSQALGKLLMITENYPELKANQNFRDLQVQLEGTENRITQERRKFNEVVQDFNTYIRQFPRNLIAGMFGFEKKGYFEADKGAEKAPTVDFN
ncbi:MAG TPA: LemA family protein [Saprospiraceae bacterium]|jgi:LemA protein|nr:MAG: LemA family protein [Candidatus Parvibacillus calidus]MBX2937916.1 LemA family protein [Saprospiraceae bacterium]MBK7741071.1 LemA family protein [Candidatus Parvibacillus calidus]MBX7178844.1 LemA family protein [Saprospiraceae bacterium]MCB0592302.1 LemA family protein [Saprospiraceae bacterium]